MATAKKLIKYFVLYILPLLFSVVFTLWVASMPSALDGLYQCQPGHQVCFAILYSLIFTIGYIVLAFIIGFMWELPPKIKQWKDIPKSKNIKLKARYLPNGNVVFTLLNGEFRKPKMWISKIQIADNPQTWFPISQANLPLKYNDTTNILFLKWDKTKRYFQAADYRDDNYHKVFGVGAHKFEILITYGFTENGNDKGKGFAIIFSFEEDGTIRVLEIKHTN